MVRLNLKNILGKKNDSASFILSFIEKSRAVVYVEDENGKCLVGNEQSGKAFHEPVIFEGNTYGWVNGDDKAAIIAGVLSHLLQKEAERKNLANEVLNLYQEINLIFNFSEMLAKSIDAKSIAQITVDEASRVIRSNKGVVILWNETDNDLQIAASSGEIFFDENELVSHLSLLRNIILSGTSEIISDVSSLINAGMIASNIQSIIYSALKVKHRIMGAVILASYEAEQYTAADLKLLTTLALQSSSAIESALLYEKNIREAHEREEAMRQVYEVTGKFVPYEFIGSLGHKFITDIKLGDQVEKIVTVLFSDIRDYTTLSEQMTPEQNFSFVCSFNERMGPIIRKHNGFINQYLGDAIMAIFSGNAADALSAAIDMQKEVQLFNSDREKNNETPIQIGVGMHTGPLIMGITGDKDRLDATTISDTVNTASRLESLTKQFKASIILSDASLQQIISQNDFQLRHLGLVQLKGKQELMSIHECFSADTHVEIEHKLATLSTFNEGMSLYLNNFFEKANEAFKEVLGYHPGDSIASFFYTSTKQVNKKDDHENGIDVVKLNNISQQLSKRSGDR